MPTRRAQAHGAQQCRKVEGRMSNFPLRYKLSWLPRLVHPSLRGERGGWLPAAASLASPAPALTRRLVFIGDILKGVTPIRDGPAIGHHPAIQFTA